MLTTRSCGFIIQDKIKMNASNNRQSHLKHFWWNLHTQEPEGNWTIENWVHVVGTAKKKNFLGEWVEYKTNHELQWDFYMGIVNERALSSIPGVVITKYNQVHSGSRTDSDTKSSSYYTSYFKANNVPSGAQSYADPIWERIMLNRHRPQGIYPEWNEVICQQ